jgi:hypothetical protein
MDKMKKIKQHVTDERIVFYCPICGWESFDENDLDTPCCHDGCDGTLSVMFKEKYDL